MAEASVRREEIGRSLLSRISSPLQRSFVAGANLAPVALLMHKTVSQ